MPHQGPWNTTWCSSEGRLNEQFIKCQVDYHAVVCQQRFAPFYEDAVYTALLDNSILSEWLVRAENTQDIKSKHGLCVRKNTKSKVNDKLYFKRSKTKHMAIKEMCTWVDHEKLIMAISTVHTQIVFLLPIFCWFFEVFQDKFHTHSEWQRRQTMMIYTREGSI